MNTFPVPAVFLKVRARLARGVFAGLAVSLASGAAVSAAPDAAGQGGEPLPEHGIRPLPAGMGGKWLNQPKPKHLHLDLGAAWFHSLGADAKGHEGWGGAATFLLMPERSFDYPKWQLKVGGELLVFHSTRSYVNSRGRPAKDSIDAGVLNFIGGVSYTFNEHVEFGVLLGAGLAGTYGETREGGHTDQNGNVNLSAQVKPSLTFHITENLSFSGSYRFGFITPVVRADLIDYRSVDIVHQSVEAALTLRF
jgi:hypothetical protein